MKFDSRQLSEKILLATPQKASRLAKEVGWTWVEFEISCDLDGIEVAPALVSGATQAVPEVEVRDEP